MEASNHIQAGRAKASAPLNSNVVSAYVGWWSVSTASLLWLLPAVVALIAAVGFS
jgi:hypothetical protein